MNHFQCDVTFQARRVQSLRPSFPLPRLLLWFRSLLVFSLIVLIHSVILSSLLSLQPKAYSLQPFLSPLSSFCVSDAHAGNVQYLYDDLGRLIAVVDGTAGEAAIYQYDAVGNLLGIVRQPGLDSQLYAKKRTRRHDGHHFWDGL